MKKLYILALVAMLLAACTTDETQDVAVNFEAPDTITVSFEDSDDTRIQLNEAQKTVWTKGDLVSVFYKSNANRKWQYQGKTGERTGELKQIAMGSATAAMDKVVVAYPYSKNYLLNLTTGDIEATLPATQHYLSDSYGLDGNLMVSSGYFTQFSLKTVCGWLKVQLTGNGERVRSIKLKGNNGEQVAGLIYVDTTTAACTLASEMGAVGDDGDGVVGGAGGNLAFDGAVVKEVTLDCGDGVTLSSEPTAFYIALPPQTFEKGLTIDVACSDGSAMTKSTENAIAIERNCIQPMTSLAYEGVIPEVFELAYTTNDGEPLDPYTTDGFGANFVENIYDAATGNGLLKFDGKITTIPEKAFIACGNLTHINIPEGITAINAEAFNGCNSLTVMDIPQGVKTIGNKAFYNCSGVTEITIPSSVTLIGTSSFEGCGGKAYINCKIHSVSSSSNGKFYKAKFAEVVIADSVTSIGNYAFYYCTSLTSLTIPNSVTSIGKSAFRGCTSLTSVTIGNRVTSIGEDAFYNCTSLTSLTIPNSVTSIGNYAFYNCTSLTRVTIPDSVTSIGYSAFKYCTSLTRVDITDLSAWCKISFGDYSASLFRNKTKLYLNGSELTDITIPSDITEIKAYAFSGYSLLTSITIPDSVTKIGKSAFEYCTKLTSITIPDSVTSIGKSAFEGCTSLTSVTIPNSVTTIGSYAFDSCTSLTSITIPDSVTSIGDGAFHGCTSLKEVYCKPTTPPTGDDDMFSYYDYNYGVLPIGCKIYVPAASVKAYKAAYGWKYYASYIEGYDF